MSYIAPPPNPCLIAIVLVVQVGRAGPRFTFHYPPDPSAVQSQSSSRPTQKDQPAAKGESDSDSENSSTSESEVEGRPGSRSLLVPKQTPLRTREAGQSPRSAAKKSDSAITVKEEDSSGHSSRDHSTSWSPPWDSFLSISTSALEKFLNPSRSWHKRRFEVGINDLCFVGWPVFIREDGTWQKKRKKTRTKIFNGDGAATEANVRRSSSTSDQDDDPAHRTKAEEASNGIGTEDTPQVESEPSAKNTMRMFNVVFVMNPPVLEYSMRVQEMYNNVIKKFGRALKWEQARADYVWKEAKAILKIKDKARERQTNMTSLYAEILSTSSLAKAIASIYNSISTNRIASVTLSEEVSISLQIPPVTSTSVLPTATDPPAQRGLWLTTADAVSDESSGNPTPSIHLAKHFALLLLQNENEIVRDIEASGGPLAGPLSHYVRASTPTKSFAQISVTHNISLADIQILARHLVFWRRARAVPPLHQRDTYVVSPNADMSKLQIATKAYAATFPALPGLPKMLSALSGSPRPYASLIPSKDHKEAYFLILAWLLRGGWVMQLRTFAWIRVDDDVKKRAYRKGATKAASSEHFANGHSKDSSYDKKTPSSDGGNEKLDEGPSQGDEMERRGRSLILRPQKASPAESAWIDQIGEDFASLARAPHNFTIEEIRELQEHWKIFTKYLNGHDALEKIPVRENLKRKRMWNMIGKLGLFDWSVGSEQRGVLLGVRHW